MFVKLLTIVFFFFSLLSQLLKSSSQSVNNFTYNGFHLPLTLISIQGKATVTPNGLLKLTHSTMYMTGHAFYNQPIRFKDSPNSTVSSFSTTFVFAIIPQVWVDYDGLTNQIDVTMAPFNHDKPIKPLVSTVRDLSSILLQDMFVGFSASTGAVVSQHFILGWSFQVKGKAPPLDLQTLPKLPELQSKRKGIPPLTAFYFAVTLLALLFFLSLLLREFVKFIFRRKIKFVEEKEEEELEDWETEFTKNRVKFKDLYSATEGFKEKDVLGSGGFGSVYKGVMPNTKKEIAVKRVSNESKQGLKEFVSEIVTIGRMSHRNLVPLLGYCRREKELLLVYDYMPNGSLDKYLHNSPEVTLDWKQRIKVIKGVASALFYLHEDWEQVVIHRDIKSSNVLLDAEYNGRLGDFGLARLCGHGTDPQTSHVAGTWGYLAPDHMRTGKTTTATDVFSFGVLLLEVACGRRPIEVHKKSGETVLLVDWVFGFWSEGNILDAKDRNLGIEFDQREVEMVLKLDYLSGDSMLPDFSPLDLRGSEMMLGTHHGLSMTGIGMFTGESSMVDSVLSGGR
uniref:non-specific serine/threonine protein kinase n=1 Tax=Brassica campestris TaxID=3711 RepID=M4F5B3_BRACM